MTVTLERPAPPKPPPPRPGGGEDRPGGRLPPNPPLQLFVWLVVTAVGMFFLGLSSALLARIGSAGWTPPPRPWPLWPGTAALVCSSVALEGARRALRRGHGTAAHVRLRAGALLGLGFLVAQLAGWGWLSSAGFALQAGPGVSYFYVLSGAHLVHVLGGLAGWLAVLRRLRREAEDIPLHLGGLAVYWHFLLALWVWLFAVLYVR